MVIRIERLRSEHFVVIAGDDMRNIVIVRPSDRGPGGYGDVCRAKAEVVNLNCGATCRFVTWAHSQAGLGSTGTSKGCHHYRRQSEYPLDSFHLGSPLKFLLKLWISPGSCQG